MKMITGYIMEYGDEKLHLNQFLGQDWIESMAMQQEPIGLEVPIPYIFGLFLRPM